jgi:hypothetical protein
VGATRIKPKLCPFICGSYLSNLGSCQAFCGLKPATGATFLTYDIINFILRWRPKTAGAMSVATIAGGQIVTLPQQS